jgi:hypothetical protein
MEQNPYQKPFIIYVFRDEKNFYAIGLAKKGRLVLSYAFGFKIEKDPKRKINAKIFQEKRAKREVITRVSNCLNAVNLYGKKVLDKDGNVDWERWKLMETLTSLDDNKNSKVLLPLEKNHPLETFKIQEISLETAINNGLFNLN